MHPPAAGSRRGQADDSVHRAVPHRAQAIEPDRATSRPGAAVAKIQLEAAWEPRLRPMLLKLNYDKLKILDDQNKEVKPQVNMEADEVVVRPENPVAEINLNLEAPERDAKKLGSLKVKAELTIPAGMCLQVPQPGPEERHGQAGRRQPDARGDRGRRAGLEGQRRAGLSRRRPGLRELSPGAIQ